MGWRGLGSPLRDRWRRYLMSRRDLVMITAAVAFLVLAVAVRCWA